MTSRRPLRVFIALWAVLQFALPTLATYADVLLERDTAKAVSHAESRSDASCRATHSAECALCQVVHRAGTAERPTTLPPCTQLVVVAWTTRQTQAYSAERRGQPGQRAPPVA